MSIQNLLIRFYSLDVLALQEDVRPGLFFLELELLQVHLVYALGHAVDAQVPIASCERGYLQEPLAVLAVLHGVLQGVLCGVLTQRVLTRHAQLVLGGLLTARYCQLVR